jgi:hypothetical protein
MGCGSGGKWGSDFIFLSEKIDVRSNPVRFSKPDRILSTL